MSKTEHSVALDDLAVVREALADDYDIVEEIGRGGMAVVYRARERALERDVAIKVLPLTRVSDFELVERFQREARTSAQLEHPNIVPIFRVGRRDPVIFFVMKLLRGESVAARLEREGTMPTEDIRQMIIQAGDALGYAARRGVVHRDIKPDNLVLDDDGRYVLTDFGIARSLFDPRLTETGRAMGTPRYMSPEQARGKNTDWRSDLYGLGVVAYQCLTGRVPFDGDDNFAIMLGHVESPLPRPRLVTNEEHALFGVIERMLAKHPDHRFQDAAELIEVLESTAELPNANRQWIGQSDVDTVAWDAPVTEPKTGPQPSPAIDAALNKGMELLRRQRPLARAVDVVVAVSTRLVAVARSRGRRFWLVVAVVMIAAVAAQRAMHYVAMQRSRCPALVDAAAGTKPRGRVFLILVDAIGTVSAGSDVDVYYDVCGLREGDAFATRVTIAKSEFGFRRFFGDPVVPVAVSFDETATGPATRWHRTLNFDEMPAGVYSLSVVVTDRAGHRREKSQQFQLER